MLVIILLMASYMLSLRHNIMYCDSMWLYDKSSDRCEGAHERGIV